MQEIISKVKYFERGLSKNLYKGNFIFLLNPVPFNRQNYQKQKGPGISDQSLLFRLRNKFRKFPLLVVPLLPKGREQLFCTTRSTSMAISGKIYTLLPM